MNNDYPTYKLVKFKYPGAYFEGVVEVVDIYGLTTTTHDCRIIYVMKSSNSEWVANFRFNLISDSFIKEVNKEENPEYFL